MRRRSLALFATLALGLTLVVLAPACRKLPDPATGGLPAELTVSGAVPAAWGNLVAVSSIAEAPDLVQLWFQDDQKAVHRVVMRITTGEFLSTAVIRRN